VRTSGFWCAQRARSRSFVPLSGTNADHTAANLSQATRLTRECGRATG
jgi:hypothetical protein